MDTSKPSSFKHTSVLCVSGNDALDFLNNLMVTDLKSMALDEVVYSVICNPKGRIVFSFFLQKRKQAFFLAVDDSLVDSLHQFLSMRIFRSSVSIQKTDIKLILTASDKLPENNTFQMLDFIEQNKISELSMFDWIVPLKYPWITQASTEKHIPQDLSIDELSVISFTKGCYPGQEIVARLHYLGQSKKALQLYRYKREKPFPIGAQLKASELSANYYVVSQSIQQNSDWMCQCVGPSKHDINTIAIDTE